MGLVLKWFVFLFFFYWFDKQFKEEMSKLFWCFVVFVLVVMVDQTEGWPRRWRRRCNARICSVSSWSSWSSCSRSCGGGRQTRSREVIANSKCGGGCPYSLGDYHYCNRSPCPGEGEAIYQHTVGVKWLFFYLENSLFFSFPECGSEWRYH